MATPEQVAQLREELLAKARAFFADAAAAIDAGLPELQVVLIVQQALSEVKRD